MTVPAPGQDNPQERAKANALLLLLDSEGDQWIEVDEIQDVASPDLIAARDVFRLSAALEAATRERDARERQLNSLVNEMPDYLWEHITVWLTKNNKKASEVPRGSFPLDMVRDWLDRAQVAERERSNYRQLYEAMCRDRDEWKDRAVAAEQALEAARDALRHVRPYVSDGDFDPPDVWLANAVSKIDAALGVSASTEDKT